MFFQNDSIYKDFKQGYGNVVIAGFQWFQYGQQNKNLYPTSYDNFADHNRWPDTLIARIVCPLPARMMSPYTYQNTQNKSNDENKKEDGKIKVFPNPFSGESSFILPENTSEIPTKFYITDITGRDASSLFKISNSNKKDNFTIKADSKSSGIYYLYTITSEYKALLGIISIINK